MVCHPFEHFKIDLRSRLRFPPLQEMQRRCRKDYGLRCLSAPLWHAPACSHRRPSVCSWHRHPFSLCRELAANLSNEASNCSIARLAPLTIRILIGAPPLFTRFFAHSVSCFWILWNRADRLAARFLQKNGGIQVRSALF